MTRPFELQGHRGARGLFPENTLHGFVAACALGVDSIELDVAVTADDIVVVSHDPELNPDLTRGPDGAWLAAAGPPIRSLTFAELQRYDVGRLHPGSGYAALYPDQVARDGARIPTLADVFAITTGVRIDVELKTLPGRPDLTVSPVDMANAVLAVAAGALDRLVVRSFDWRGLRHLRKTAPGIPLVWLTSARTVFTASVPATVAAEAGTGATWAPEHTVLTPVLIDEAHALGLRAIAWTVNDPADMARLIAWGIDGLCTDRPDVAHDAMRACGLSPPPPLAVPHR